MHLHFPSFSGFFAFFDVGRMWVDAGRLQTFPKKRKFSSLRKVEGVLYQHTIFRFLYGESSFLHAMERDDVGRCRSFTYLSM